jgi:hypothetical protein
VQEHVPGVVAAEVEAALTRIVPDIGDSVAAASVTEMQARVARMLERNHARTIASVKQILKEEEFVEILDAALTRSRSYGQTVETRLRAASGGTGGTVTALTQRER